MGWPQVGATVGRVLGRASGPAATGLLTNQERDAESRRAARPDTTAAGRSAVVAVFHAPGILDVGRPAAGLGDGTEAGTYLVMRSGRIGEVGATLGRIHDVALDITAYRYRAGSDTPETIGEFTLLAGARADIWGLDLRVGRGEVLAVGFDLAGSTSDPGSALTVQFHIQ